MGRGKLSPWFSVPQQRALRKVLWRPRSSFLPLPAVLVVRQLPYQLVVGGGEGEGVSLSPFFFSEVRLSSDCHFATPSIVSKRGEASSGWVSVAIGPRERNC